ncbi:MAG: helix-turn-helix domain-containing protein [Candidatus Riflebacteria bacterium]|nr:helix-turn-helix domain-containing protein [Candidatus Riflebacteria bacterium]
MKDSDFNNLVASIKEAGKIRRGEMKPSRVFEITPLDVKQIREKLHKTQQEFALMIGISVATLRNWEQGRRRPEGPAMVLLKIAQTNPELISQALLNS